MSSARASGFSWVRHFVSSYTSELSKKVPGSTRPPGPFCVFADSWRQLRPSKNCTAAMAVRCPTVQWNLVPDSTCRFKQACIHASQIPCRDSAHPGPLGPELPFKRSIFARPSIRCLNAPLRTNPQGPNDSWAPLSLVKCGSSSEAPPPPSLVERADEQKGGLELKRRRAVETKPEERRSRTATETTADEGDGVSLASGRC